MRTRTLVVLAAVTWLGGFVLLRSFGSVLPLFGAAAALAGALAWRDPTTRASLALRLGPFVAGVAAAAAMIAATYLLYPVCVRLWPPLGVEVHGLYGLLFHGLGKGAVAAVVVTLSACEELLFRGRLLDRPAGRPAPLRLLLAAGFYAAVHLTSGSATLVALAFCCGLAWGLLRLVTGSLWSSIVCHVAWDLAIMIIAPLA